MDIPMLSFSIICKAFYHKREDTALFGITSQTETANFFLKAALESNFEAVVANAKGEAKDWFTDKVHFSEWKIVKDCIESSNFQNTVASSIIDAKLPQLFKVFSINVNKNEKPNKNAFIHAFTKQFKLIAHNNGKAENIMNEAYSAQLKENDYSEYLNKAKDSFGIGKVKTLLYSSPRHFYDFFVCSTLELPDEFEKKKIENATLDKLLKYGNCTLLTGTGGIGKSQMCRHLFLSAANVYKDTKKLPILVILREFRSNESTSNLIDLILYSVTKYDELFTKDELLRLMKLGDCQIILDGLDEVNPSCIKDFEHELERLINQYNKNQYVMSSRRFGKFLQYPSFTILSVLPFTKEQAIELIDKLDFEKEVREKFKVRLKEDYFEILAESFWENPLLLTLTLMTYDRYAEIPEKEYLLYEAAYSVLLKEHDATKNAYKRMFRSVSDSSDFTKVFKEFSAKSYRHGDYEFREDKIEKYFSKLTAVQQINSETLTTENFLYDACNNVSIMYEEGRKYTYIHRSFQEYFFAEYYGRQDNETLIKLGKQFMQGKISLVYDSLAFDMLYDIAPEKVERFIFLPYLKKIFDNVDNTEAYWHFLDIAYGMYRYCKIDESIDKMYNVNYESGILQIRANDSDSEMKRRWESLMRMILLKTISEDSHYYLDRLYKNFTYDDLPIIDKLYGGLCEQTLILEADNFLSAGGRDDEAVRSLSEFNALLKDELGNLKIIGYIHEFPFKYGLDPAFREKYADIIGYFENDKELTAQFEAVYAYYEKILELNAKATIDDDDF